MFHLAPDLNPSIRFKVLGPYVEGLTKIAATSADQIQELMEKGQSARHVAATKMNATSSRSHAVFTIVLTELKQDATTKLMGEKVLPNKSSISK